MAPEKRLIDANAADLETLSCYYGSSCYVEDVQSWLDEQPTVDAVEVVRCKDCKHRYYNEYNEMYCCEHWSDGFDTVVCEDSFCSYGERK